MQIDFVICSGTNESNDPAEIEDVASVLSSMEIVFQVDGRKMVPPDYPSFDLSNARDAHVHRNANEALK